MTTLSAVAESCRRPVVDSWNFADNALVSVRGVLEKDSIGIVFPFLLLQAGSRRASLLLGSSLTAPKKHFI